MILNSGGNYAMNGLPWRWSAAGRPDHQRDGTAPMAKASIPRIRPFVKRTRHPAEWWVGQRFGMMLVLSASSDARPGLRVLCRCDCGAEKVVRAPSLIEARGTRSCGCWRRDAAVRKRFRHGHAVVAGDGYGQWRRIKDRCRNPDHPAFHNYGGRGIDICDEWFNDVGAFKAAIGSRPSLQHTVERIDNSRGYEPGNVRWATRGEQSRNTRANRILSHDGREMCLADWALSVGLRPATLANRLRMGWSLTESLSRKLRPSRWSMP